MMTTQQRRNKQNKKHARLCNGLKMKRIEMEGNGASQCLLTVKQGEETKLSLKVTMISNKINYEIITMHYFVSFTLRHYHSL